MSNFKDDILAETEGEDIEAIVIGQYGWGGFLEEERENKVEVVQSRVLTWVEAAPMLDYSYETGYGSPKCHAVTAWTKSYVLFVSQYDGATSVERVPRNPVNHKPNMPGG